MKKQYKVTFRWHDVKHVEFYQAYSELEAIKQLIRDYPRYHTSFMRIKAKEIPMRDLETTLENNEFLKAVVWGLAIALSGLIGALIGLH